MTETSVYERAFLALQTDPCEVEAHAISGRMTRRNRLQTDPCEVEALIGVCT